LLADLDRAEVERLLVKVLPASYLEDSQAFGGDQAYLVRLLETYGEVYAIADAGARRKAAERYLEVIRQEGQRIVEAWEDNFFRADMLDAMQPPERTMVKAHLLARLSEERSAELFNAAKGLGSRVTSKEQGEIINAAISEIVYGYVAEGDRAARDLLDDLSRTQGPEADKRMLGRMDSWIEFLKQRSKDAEAAKVEAVKSRYEDLDDLPF
jgi:hypothetical protein